MGEMLLGTIFCLHLLLLCSGVVELVQIFCSGVRCTFSQKRAMGWDTYFCIISFIGGRLSLGLDKPYLIHIIRIVLLLLLCLPACLRNI